MIENSDIQLDNNAFSIHLWENSAGVGRLDNITEDYINTVDTTYNKLARRFLYPTTTIG